MNLAVLTTSCAVVPVDREIRDSLSSLSLWKMIDASVWIEKLINMFNSLGVPENEQIQHKMLSDAIEKAQKKIESNNFGIRKNLLEYDQVMNEQRELIYAQRRRVLEGENMKDRILSMIADKVSESVNMCCTDEVATEDWDLYRIKPCDPSIIPLQPITSETLEGIKNTKQLIEKLTDEANALYAAKEAEFPEPDAFREIERVILLRVIDRKWMEEIDDMEQLRQGIGMQAFAQRNPIDEYKMASYDMLDAMNDAIRTETVQMLYRIRIEKR